MFSTEMLKVQLNCTSFTLNVKGPNEMLKLMISVQMLTVQLLSGCQAIWTAAVAPAASAHHVNKPLPPPSPHMTSPNVHHLKRAICIAYALSIPLRGRTLRLALQA